MSNPTSPIRLHKARFSENEEIILAALRSLDLLKMPTVFSFDTSVMYGGCAYSFVTTEPRLHLFLGMLGGDEGRGIFAEVLQEELERLEVTEMVIAGRVGVRMRGIGEAREFTLSVEGNHP